MNKITRVLKWILNAVVNVIILAGVAILLAWVIWGVSPQTSITNVAHFFANSWYFVSGQSGNKEFKHQVTREQLEESSKKTMYYYGE